MKDKKSGTELRMHNLNSTFNFDPLDTRLILVGFLVVLLKVNVVVKMFM